MIAAADTYTPPLTALRLLLMERTSFRSCLFSGLVRVDLSIVLISSNRANRCSACAASAVFPDTAEIGSLPEDAINGENRAADNKNAVNIETDSFFIIIYWMN